MEKYFQIGPDFVDPVFAGDLEHPVEDRKHPRWNAADVGHIFLEGFPGDPVAFLLEIGKQRRFFLRDTHQVGQRVDILDEDGAQVTHQRIFQVVVRAMAASQNQSLAVEKPALRVVGQIESHGIVTTLQMRLLQPVRADRDEL